MTLIRCPLCGASAERFAPIDPRFEAEALRHGFPHPFSAFETLNLQDYACPGCGAADRDRLIGWSVATLQSLIHAAARGALRPRPALLDLAPAPGLALWLRALGWDYRSADLNRDDVDDRIDLNHATPYADGQFDLVICSHVLEHIADDRQALREIHRVLSPGGMAILLVPLLQGAIQARTDEDACATSEGERWRRFAQGDHFRLYNRDDFLARIADAGFTVAPLMPAAAIRAAHGFTATATLYLGLCLGEVTADALLAARDAAITLGAPAGDGGSPHACALPARAPEAGHARAGHLLTAPQSTARAAADAHHPDHGRSP